MRLLFSEKLYIRVHRYTYSIVAYSHEDVWCGAKEDEGAAYIYMDVERTIYVYRIVRMMMGGFLRGSRFI